MFSVQVKDFIAGDSTRSIQSKNEQNSTSKVMNVTDPVRWKSFSNILTIIKSHIKETLINLYPFLQHAFPGIEISKFSTSLYIIFFYLVFCLLFSFTAAYDT